MSNKLHAHFDCFSGAAGDMMLASCLDASNNPDELLQTIIHSLKMGIPAIKDEFDIRIEKVWRGGMGSIAGLKVHVDSIYNHKAAPVPKSSNNDHQEGIGVQHHDHDHSHKYDQHTHHDHSHEHSHEHNHEHLHKHDHGHEHTLEHVHKHDHNHEHKHEHVHKHEHTHDHSHEHSHQNTGPLRNLPQIRELIQNAPPEYIPLTVQNLAIQTFTELAIAESYTHGTSGPDTVHFHEVGAIDSIVDIIGTILALHHLSISTVSCSRIPMGEGMVWTDHGQLPVPALATMRLLIGMKTCKGPGCFQNKNNSHGNSAITTQTGELVTPTAAALLRVLSGVADYEKHKKNEELESGAVSKVHNAAIKQPRVGRPPNFTPRAIGIGAGTKDFKKHPNIIRLIIGDEVELDDNTPLVPSSNSKPRNNDQSTTTTIHNKIDDLKGNELQVLDRRKGNVKNNVLKSEVMTTKSIQMDQPTTKSKISWHIDRLTLLEANIDDITAEILSHVIELLLNNGAIDAWVTNIVMKKGRSAHTLHCICHSNINVDDDETTVDASTKLLDIIFRHTTTLGVRIRRDVERASLRRQMIQVQTKYVHQSNNVPLDGIVRVKLGILDDDVVSMKAEFEDCKIISNHTGVPIKKIAEDATMIARKQIDSTGFGIP